MYSRYAKNQVITNPGERIHFSTWDLPQKLKVLSPIDYFGGIEPIRHVWQLSDRLDKLANKYFEDDTLWWIISFANGISNPLSIQPGTEILIPKDKNFVLEKLNLG